jgi:hypothetical protein
MGLARVRRECGIIAHRARRVVCTLRYGVVILALSFAETSCDFRIKAWLGELQKQFRW